LQQRLPPLFERNEQEGAATALAQTSGVRVTAAQGATTALEQAFEARIAARIVAVMALEQKAPEATWITEPVQARRASSTEVRKDIEMQIRFTMAVL